MTDTETETPIADAPASVEASFDERISAQLIARGRLKEADLGRARRLHEENPEGDFISLMTRLGLVSERDAAEALAEVMKLPLLAAKECPDAPPPSVQVSTRFLKQYHVVPIGEDDASVSLLVAEPQDPYPAEAMRLATGKRVNVRVGLRSEIDDLIERYYGSGRSAMGTIVENLSDDATRSAKTMSSTCATWLRKRRSSAW
jgi:general secretion pathway protein E